MHELIRPCGARYEPRYEPRYRATTALALIAGLASWAIACGGAAGSDRDHDPHGATVPLVEVLQARSGSLPLEERLNGVVKAQNQVSIRPEIDAQVVEVMVRSGEAVQKGQPLVRLDDTTLREQLRQGEAALQLAQAAAVEAVARVTQLEAQVSRTRVLAAQSLVPPVDLETQEAQLAAAEAAARQAEARVEQTRATRAERSSALGRTVVRAPVAGRVGRRNAEVGMLVDRSTELFQLGNLDHLLVEIPLTEGMLGYIREDQPVRISAGVLGEEVLRASLSRISPFLAQGSFSTTGEIDVRNLDGRLRPGMFVTVDVLYGQSETATLVPTSAVWEDPRTGIHGAYVVEDLAQGLTPTTGGETDIVEGAYPATFRPVEVLAEGRETVGINGVEPGEWVVTLGQNLLHSGQPTEAHVRPTSWERLLGLQSLQREDLLKGFLEKQRRVAREIGAELPPVAAAGEEKSAPSSSRPTID